MRKGNKNQKLKESEIGISTKEILKELKGNGRNPYAN